MIVFEISDKKDYKLRLQKRLQQRLQRLQTKTAKKDY